MHTNTHRHTHSPTATICLPRPISVAFTWLDRLCVRSSVSKRVQWIFARPCVCKRCACVRARSCLCAWGYAGWSRCPVRRGQMVLGGWLSSWWPGWWCCLWSLLIRYASLPESPSPSQCLCLCRSLCSQFMSVCLHRTPICICSTLRLCVYATQSPSHSRTNAHSLCALHKHSQILRLNPPDTDSELQSVFFLAVLHHSDQLWERADTSAAKSKAYLSSGREEWAAAFN